MTVTINNLKRRPGGRESIRARDYEGDAITIGRDASNDLTISDLNISLKHATLGVDENGNGVFSLLPGCSARVNGRLVTGKTTVVAPQSKIGIGRFELRIEKPAGPGNVTATLEQMEAAPIPISAEDEEKVFSLQSALPGKRLMAWVFSLAVLGFFLALPIWAHRNPDNAQVKSLPVQADLSWDSGELSLMHVNLKNDCKVCHVKAFKAVEDKTCVTCHKDLIDHAAPQKMRASRPEPVGFNAKLDEVSNIFGRPPERCAACHVEHNGTQHLIERDQNLCVDCHKDLHNHLKDTKLANVSDFGTDHPEFSPYVITEPSFTNPVFTRMALDKNPKGFSGLKFPHDMHMKKGDAVAKMARKLALSEPDDRYGFADGVDCGDCHRPEAGNALFEPVSMVQDCAMCHDIGFEDDNGYLRTLRHGEPKEVIASMRDFYQAKALGNIRDAEMNSRTRRRPGSAARIRDLNRRELAFRQADIRTAAKVKSIFSKGGACADCHVIEFPTDPASLDYRVRPISLNDSFYPNSTFNHQSHEVGNLTCKSCHATETSKLSSDILLPKIKICRDCHIGEESYRKGGKFAAGTLPSTCLTCHTYHGGPHGALMGQQSK